MPLVLEGRIAGAAASTPLDPLGDDRRRPEHQWRPGLEIGLVNNMPDAALRATERQFIDLLAAAAGDTLVRLHLFSLPELPRGPAARAHVKAGYADLSQFKNGRLDALIVTGSEPIAASLSDEPYWQALTDVVDWAEQHTISTIWSCLAAHAAVLHLDGIGRRRLPAKRFGLYEFVPTGGHPMLDGVTSPMWVPHSRWNDLAESDLRAHGYEVLTRSAVAGVDIFAKQWNSLFLFLQGHPEYNPDTLFREYRRDMTRYLRGERDSIPDLPAHYFDARSEKALARFGLRAKAERSPELVARLPECGTLTGAIDEWRASAIQIYRNWLHYVATMKSRQSLSGGIGTEAH